MPTDKDKVDTDKTKNTVKTQETLFPLPAPVTKPIVKQTTTMSDPIAGSSGAIANIQPQIPLTTIEQKKLELLEEIRQLDVYVEQAKEKAKTNTEKEVLLRDLRAKRRDAKQKLAELIIEDEEAKYTANYEAQLMIDSQQGRAAAIAKIGITGVDDIKPKDDLEKSKYNRALNMCTHYKNAIKNTNKR